MKKNFNSGKLSKESEWQERALKQGRSMGSGASYESLIQVRKGDHASHGVSHLLQNPLLGREHHLLSTLEKIAAMKFLSCNAGDLQEQYRLRHLDDDPDYTVDDCVPSGTLTLAAEMGIRHPQISVGKPRILTEDILVTDKARRQWATFIRYRKDLPRPGTRQQHLLELHRRYWVHRGVPFHVLTEEDFDPRQTNLLLWARTASRKRMVGTYSNFLPALRAADRSQPLIQVVTAAAGGGCHAPLDLFKAAVFYGLILVDMPELHVPPVTHPWPFRFADPGQLATGLKSFFDARKELT